MAGLQFAMGTARLEVALPGPVVAQSPTCRNAVRLIKLEITRPLQPGALLLTSRARCAIVRVPRFPSSGRFSFSSSAKHPMQLLSPKSLSPKPRGSLGLGSCTGL